MLRPSEYYNFKIPASFKNCHKALFSYFIPVTVIGALQLGISNKHVYIYMYIKWTVFVNVTTKSAQHAHARMIAIIVKKKSI